MNLQLTGRHLEITDALRDYTTAKLGRITRHFDHVLDARVTLSVEKLSRKAEVTLHVPGRDFFCISEDPDMYAAIDALVDKLDRMVVEHKEKQVNHHGEPGLKHRAD
jgi:putative sigma-54 modulation protein